MPYGPEKRPRPEQLVVTASQRTVSSDPTIWARFQTTEMIRGSLGHHMLIMQLKLEHLTTRSVLLRMQSCILRIRV